MGDRKGMGICEHTAVAPSLRGRVASGDVLTNSVQVT